MLLSALNPVLQKFAELFPSVLGHLNLSLETLKEIEKSPTSQNELALAIQSVINRYGPEVFVFGVLLNTQTSDGLDQFFIDDLLQREEGEGMTLRFRNTFLCDKYADRKIDISGNNPQRKVQEYIVQRRMNDAELGKHAEFGIIDIFGTQNSCFSFHLKNNT